MSILKYGKEEFFAKKVMLINRLINEVEVELEFGVIGLEPDEDMPKFILADDTSSIERTSKLYYDMVKHRRIADDLTVEDFEFVLNLSGEEMEEYKTVDREFYGTCMDLDWISDVLHTALFNFLGEDLFDIFAKAEDDYIYKILPVEDLYKLCKDELDKRSYGVEELKTAIKYIIEDRDIIFSSVA